jgi:hypothetical protein
VITRAGTDPRHGPGSQSRGSTGTRLAHRPRREPVNDLAAGPAAWTRITPQVCLKRSVMVHLDGAAVVRRRNLLTRRQRTRSLTRTCQGSQHRPAASADNTITRVHQVCPAGRGPRGLLVSPYPHRGTGKCCAPTTTPGDREHDLLGCGESLWRPTALMDLMRSGSDGGPARKR